MKKLAIILIIVMAITNLTACSETVGQTMTSDTVSDNTEIYIQERSGISMEVGQSLSGYVKVYSDRDLSLDDLLFVSSDETVATFTPTEIIGSSTVEYMVLAFSSGTATFTVATKDGLIVSNSVTVTVNDASVITTTTAETTAQTTTEATTTPAATTEVTTTTEATTTPATATEVTTITEATTTPVTTTKVTTTTKATTAKATTTETKTTEKTDKKHTSSESDDEYVSSRGTICLVEMTSFVYNNNMASLTIQGKPDTEYFISVYYSSGASEAKGLERKTSDSNGYVTWEWKVGAKTKEGSHRIVITGGSDSLTVYFTTEKE